VISGLEPLVLLTHRPIVVTNILYVTKRQGKSKLPDQDNSSKLASLILRYDSSDGVTEKIVFCASKVKNHRQIQALCVLTFSTYRDIVFSLDPSYSFFKRMRSSSSRLMAQGTTTYQFRIPFIHLNVREFHLAGHHLSYC
jgi:hypothetical protein